MEISQDSFSSWRRMGPLVGYLLFATALVMLTLLRAHADAATSAAENRALAALPSLPHDAWSWHEFPGKFEAFLRERMWRRTEFVDAHARVKTTFFRTSTTPQVIVAPSGHWFLAGHTRDRYDLVRVSCGHDSFSADEVDLLERRLAATSTHLRTRGAVLGYAVIPTNLNIWWDRLPGHLRAHCDNAAPRRSTQLGERLRRSSIGFYYAFNDARAQREALPVIPADRFHWTKRGAASIATPLLAEALGVRSDLATTTVVVPGEASDLGRLLGLADGGNEDIETIRAGLPRHELGPQELGAASWEELGLRAASYTRWGSQRESRLLLITDSFGWSAASALSVPFDETLFFDLVNQRLSEAGILEKLVETYRPTHVLFLLHEGGMAWMSSPWMHLGADRAGRDREDADPARSASSADGNAHAEVVSPVDHGPGELPVPELHVGVAIDFSSSLADAFLGAGFSHREQWGRWTDGPSATLRFGLHGATGARALAVDVSPVEVPNRPEPRHVKVWVNGVTVGRWSLVQRAQLEVPIVASAGVVEVRFEFENPVCPRVAGYADDSRLLGLYFYSARIR